MKKFFFFLFLVSQLTFAQTENFSVVNKLIEWNNVYESKLTINDVYSFLKESGKFKISDSTKSSISGTVENIDADYKGAGFTRMGTNIAILNATTKGNFHIDFKDGKYRVLLKNLLNKTISTIQYSPLNGMSANSEYSFEFLGLKNGSNVFNSTFINKPLKIYNYTFTNLFDFSKYESKNNDW